MGVVVTVVVLVVEAVVLAVVEAVEVNVDVSVENNIVLGYMASVRAARWSYCPKGVIETSEVPGITLIGSRSCPKQRRTAACSV